MDSRSGLALVNHLFLHKRPRRAPKDLAPESGEVFLQMRKRLWDSGSADPGWGWLVRKDLLGSGRIAKWVGFVLYLD